MKSAFFVFILATLGLTICYPRQEPVVIIDNSQVEGGGVFYETPEPTTTPKKTKQAKPTKATDYISWKITAYCPCEKCSGKYGRNTSTGKIAKKGRTVAVDPSIVKYGSKVIIDGKEYIAEDCGGGVKGYHIDIFFDTHEEVENFGKKYKRVKIRR